MTQARSDREGFEARDFLALAQQVWPRDYSVQTQSALQLTINIGAWVEHELVGRIRIPADGYFFCDNSRNLGRSSFSTTWNRRATHP